jgi:outer membrane immunogenic protein
MPRAAVGRADAASRYRGAGAFRRRSAANPIGRAARYPNFNVRMRMVIVSSNASDRRRRNMRRVVIALLGVTALSVAANAADLPVRAPFAPAPVAAPFTWTGCYLGGHAGAGWAYTNWSNTTNTTAFGDLAAGQGYSQTNAGFVGGGQIGCNYQALDWVFGVEGTFAGSTIKGNVNNTLFGVADDVFTTKIDSIATATGRLGYAWNNWLFYGKVGYAGGEVKFSVSDTVGITGSGSSSNWQNGWTVGGGVEYALTANWIAGVEYDYIDLLTKSYDVGGGAGVYAFDVHPQIHQVLARLSYKF